MTASEKYAREGIDLLVRERDAARKAEASVTAAFRAAQRRVEELERRMYAGPASIMTSYTDFSMERIPEMRAYHIELRPNRHCYRIADTALISAEQPMKVIDDAIEQVLKRHCEDLRGQLRAQAWQFCR